MKLKEYTLLIPFVLSIGYGELAAQANAVVAKNKDQTIDNFYTPSEEQKQATSDQLMGTSKSNTDGIPFSAIPPLVALGVYFAWWIWEMSNNKKTPSTQSKPPKTISEDENPLTTEK